jgi:hypothetical protein
MFLVVDVVFSVLEIHLVVIYEGHSLRTAPEVTECHGASNMLYVT